MQNLMQQMCLISTCRLLISYAYAFTDKLCTCVLAVLQKYRRQLKPHGLDNLSIGFSVYEVIQFAIV